MRWATPVTQWAAPGGVRRVRRAADAALDAVAVPRPAPTPEARQHGGVDEADDDPTGRAAVAEHRSVPHIRRIREERLDVTGAKRHPARRRVVERTLGWLPERRALPVRHDEKACSFLGLIHLARALLGYRRLHRRAGDSG